MSILTKLKNLSFTKIQPPINQPDLLPEEKQVIIDNLRKEITEDITQQVKESMSEFIDIRSLFNEPKEQDSIILKYAPIVISVITLITLIVRT